MYYNYWYFTDADTCPDVCDQYCSPSPQLICACDHGYYLASDDRTCIGKSIANGQIIKHLNKESEIRDYTLHGCIVLQVSQVIFVMFSVLQLM